MKRQNFDILAPSHFYFQEENALEIFVLENYIETLFMLLFYII